MISTLAILLAPLVGGLWIVEIAGQSWPDVVKIRVWLLLAIFPIVARQVIAIVTTPQPRQTPDGFATQVSSLARVSLKSLALALSWSAALAWALFCSLINSSAAIVFLDDVIPLLPYLLGCIPLAIMLLERLEGPTLDQWYRLGAALTGRQVFNVGEHKNALLTTALKAFFVPLMYGNVILAMGMVLQLGAFPTSQNWVPWFYAVGLSMDLVVGTIGYIFACRALRTEVRSVDDSALGWLVCLICYAPLYEYVKILTQQTDTYTWSDWLNPSQLLYWVWAILVVSTWLIYWFSHTAFGLRFSNLSYRGLIDIGPYRYFRQPAYISKCLYWWLATVPFYGVLGTADLIRNIAGMSLLTFIYYMRARTEERHLSRFPEYVEYSRGIDRRWGGFRRALAMPIHKIT